MGIDRGLNSGHQLIGKILITDSHTKSITNFFPCVQQRMWDMLSSREREFTLLLTPTLLSRRGGSWMKRNGVMKDVSAYLRNLRNLRLRKREEPHD